MHRRCPNVRGSYPLNPTVTAAHWEPELSSAVATARGLQVNLSFREVYVACSNNDSCPSMVISL